MRSDIALTILAWIGYFLAAYVLIVVGFYFAMMVIALVRVRRNRKFERPLDFLGESEVFDLGVSVLVPAYNEEAGILQSVRSLLKLRYTDYEILVVDDGASDNTSALLIKEFDMEPADFHPREDALETAAVLERYQSSIHPNLRLIRKENGGKADTLNCGINYSAMEYVCTVDGDSMLEQHALQRIMRPFVFGGGDVAVAGGTVELMNGNDVVGGMADKQVNFSENPLVAMQALEYYRSYLIGRVALSQFNLMLVCSGAFTVFDKSLLIRYGGLARGALGEDMEVIVRLQKSMRDDSARKRIVHVPDAICYTEAPETLKVLRLQRRRWHQGMWESLSRHRRVTCNPKYRSLGLVAFPYFWIAEALLPLIELAGWIYLFLSFFAGQLFLEFSIVFIAFFIIYSGVVNTIAVMLSAWQQGKYPSFAEITYILGLSFTEIFWYKPLVLFWRLEGIFRFLNKQSEWGKMDRVGLGSSQSKAVVP
ncbi:Glycosyltransferase, catalytic subunit of cellulose synthase and poly-beta-1,6-N-acetylglucosamine synthase [Corynebacterium mycetoides]|uniref:Glycosyltransferase, catalytic subunit of cellulose synthase and poly-beta-1,6-N-acetylglucosamine synthase n=1 Tax=Corynebacterium mycetoides TaxID=38302 RepID=A0A1G9QXR1_9CORY|nr:glycosyltransferase [Corynebacterium mycetoides]SDM15764.1 Glycosyltransferase, catalytic subunit of cellulose synthase and poly-beta-1,6-N-acetylglucosamine synthase [Corynebacterium mycetoides]